MMRIRVASCTEAEVVLKIPGRIEEPGAAQVLEAEGERWLDTGRRLVLDLDDTYSINDAGLEVLQRWAHQGRPLLLRGGSFVIEFLLARYGLRAETTDPSPDAPPPSP